MTINGMKWTKGETDHGSDTLKVVLSGGVEIDYPQCSMTFGKMKSLSVMVGGEFDGAAIESVLQ